MVSIVLLGEKDHGKSTLIGRLFFDTNSMPKDRLKTISQNLENKKKVEWAHILDSLRYERKKEMTLDTTRIKICLHRKVYEFVDVPGHKQLMKNMRLILSYQK